MVLKAHPTDPDKLIFDNKDRIELLNALSAPPQREWQGLTDEEIMDACAAVWASHPIEVGNVVQDLLKEKNT